MKNWLKGVFHSFCCFFGLNRSILSLLVMVILVGLGEKMAERFLPLYLLAIGGTTFSVGFLNGMDNLLSALYSYPGGWLTEKIGTKKALTLFTLLAMFGFSIVIIIPKWWAVLVGAIFFISWTAISLPAIMSLVSSSLPKNKRTMGVSVHSFIRRIPMALGPLLGGLLIGYFGISLGTRIAFSIALLLGLLSILIVNRYIHETPTEKKSIIHLRHSFRFITGDLKNLLISDILIRFAEQIPYAFVVIWAINNQGITPFQFGVLTTIEMITAMTIYIPIAVLADKTTKKPWVLIAFINFTLFPLVLYFSRSFPALVFAFILRGMKEFGEPTRKALIMDLAPEDAKAITFGTYYLIRDVVVSIAAFSSALLWNVSPGTNFMVAFFCGLVGTLYFAIKGKD